MSDETVGGFRRMDTEKDNNPGVAMYGEKWQYPPRSFSETAYLWSDGIWRTSAEPIPAIDFDRRTAACLRACVGVPTEALERAGECADHGVIPTLAAQYRAERDALRYAMQELIDAKKREVFTVEVEANTEDELMNAWTEMHSYWCAVETAIIKAVTP